jgi:hypothetical protein
MAMGQAAGTAAASALQTGNNVRDISIAQLQQQLRRDGALFSGTAPTP